MRDVFDMECSEKSATKTRNELTTFGTSGSVDNLAGFRQNIPLEYLEFANAASSSDFWASLSRYYQI